MQAVRRGLLARRESIGPIEVAVDIAARGAGAGSTNESATKGSRHLSSESAVESSRVSSRPHCDHLSYGSFVSMSSSAVDSSLASPVGVAPSWNVVVRPMSASKVVPRLRPGQGARRHGAARPNSTFVPMSMRGRSATPDFLIQQEEWHFPRDERKYVPLTMYIDGSLSRPSSSSSLTRHGHPVPPQHTQDAAAAREERRCGSPGAGRSTIRQARGLASSIAPFSEGRLLPASPAAPKPVVQRSPTRQSPAVLLSPSLPPPSPQSRRTSSRPAAGRDVAASWMSSSRSWLRQGESCLEQGRTALGSPGQFYHLEGPAHDIHDCPNVGAKATLSRTVLHSPRGKVAHAVFRPGGPTELNRVASSTAFTATVARSQHCRRGYAGPDPYNVSLTHARSAVALRPHSAGRFAVDVSIRTPHPMPRS